MSDDVKLRGEESYRQMAVMFLGLLLELKRGQKIAISRKCLDHALEMINAGDIPIKSGVLPNGDVYALLYVLE